VAAVDVVAAGAACRVGVRVCVSCCAVCCGLRASAVVWAPATPGSPCRVGWGRRGRVAVARARCPRVQEQVWGCLSLSTKSHRASRTRGPVTWGPWAYADTPVAAGHATTRPAEPPVLRTTAPGKCQVRTSMFSISYFVALGTHVRCGCLSLSAARGTQLRSLRSPQRDTSLGRVLSITTPSIDESVSHRLFHTVLRPARPSGGRVDGAACWHRERIADRCMRDALLSPAPHPSPPSAWPYRPLYLSTCFMVRSIIASASAYTETHSSSHTAASAALSPLAPTIF